MQLATPEPMPLRNILESNQLCQMLGIRYPICQAGMYSVAYGKLAAAVSNAGGLGVIGSAFMDPEQLRRELQLVKNETDKPYGVDILFAEVGGGDATAGGYTQEVEDHIAVTFEEGCSVIVSGLGDPGRIVPRAHDAGMKVMSLVGTSRQAKGRSFRSRCSHRFGPRRWWTCWARGDFATGGEGGRQRRHSSFGGRRYFRRARPRGGAGSRGTGRLDGHPFYRN